MMQELIVKLSQVRGKPFRTINDLQEIYNDISCPEKLKNNINKIFNSSKENIAISSFELENKQIGMGNLNTILTSFGGSGITGLRGIEEDLDKLLQRGQLWVSHGVKKMKGKESQCHRNASSLWDANKENKNVFLATGYALSEDGLWYQHSWCLLKRPKSVSVVETTSPKRLAYFGYVMTEEEAEQFYFDNF